MSGEKKVEHIPMYVQFHKNMDQLNLAVNSLRKLHHDLIGEPIENKKDGVINIPSLHAFLTEGSLDCEKQVKRIEDIIQRMRVALL